MDKCVFWFPTIHHLPINKRLKRFETIQRISDFGEAAFLKIEIRHQESTVDEAKEDPTLIERSITITVFKTEIDGTECNLFSPFELKHKDHSRNGMVEYEYKKPVDYPPLNASNPPDFKKFLATICYHHVKSLFHDHEVHCDRDSGLIAFIPPQNDNGTSIKDNDNDALMFFLKQYEETFSSYAEKISHQLQKYDKQVTKFEGRINPNVESDSESGYKELIKYGLSDFRRWFYSQEHNEDVETLKKNVLLGTLVIHPHNNRISCNLQSYIERLKTISLYYKYLSNNNSPSSIEQEEVIDVSKLIKKAISKLKKLDDGRSHYYRRDFSSLHVTLSKLEITLGIHDTPSSIFRFSAYRYYKELNRQIQNFPLLTQDTRKFVSQYCEAASTEYVYCKTLIESKYNWSVKANNYYDSETADERRRTALNIRNSMRYIESAKYRCSNAQTGSTHSILTKADQLSSVAMWIAIIGMAITIFSFIIAVFDFAKQ